MKRLSILLFIFFLCINLLPQTIYYVDASNTPPGSGTINDPWSGFNTWDINTLQGTSIEIWVAPGTYSGGSYSPLIKRQALIWIHSKSNIKIRPYIPQGGRQGEVIFRGDNGNIDWGVIIKTNSTPISNIEIDSIRFTNYLEDGILIEGRGSSNQTLINNVHVKHCIIDSVKGNPDAAIVSSAIKAQFADSILIKYCNIELLNTVNPVSSQFDGIFMGAVSNAVIDSNYLKLTNNYYPIVDTPHIDCIQVTSSQSVTSRNVTVMNNNIIFDGTYGAGYG